MDKVREIELVLIKQNIGIEWTYMEDFQGKLFEFKFYREHKECSMTISKWDVENNTNNIIRIVSEYFQNCKLLLTT